MMMSKSAQFNEINPPESKNALKKLAIRIYLMYLL